jgi:SHS2 domain-containing protein
MMFEILEDITCADIAFRAYGEDLPELFRSSAEALMSVMLENPDSISQDTRVDIKLSKIDIDILLFEFLQELLFYKDSDSLLLLPQTIDIRKEENKFSLECRLSGDRIDLNKHRFNVDVKAVTMHKFQIKTEKGRWSATVVLDV